MPDYGGDGFVLMGAGINKVLLSLGVEVQIKIEVGLHRYIWNKQKEKKGKSHAEVEKELKTKPANVRTRSSARDPRDRGHKVIAKVMVQVESFRATGKPARLTSSYSRSTVRWWFLPQTDEMARTTAMGVVGVGRR